MHTTTFRWFSVLFQVNASGQFCGVAEMVGPVDFGKSVEYWQQDKWNGRFTVKWHIIKDIPNCQFRHIILENNDNKPVTNSRDTQEVINPSLFGLHRDLSAVVGKLYILACCMIHHGFCTAAEHRYMCILRQMAV